MTDPLAPHTTVPASALDTLRAEHQTLTGKYYGVISLLTEIHNKYQEERHQAQRLARCENLHDDEDMTERVQAAVDDFNRISQVLVIKNQRGAFSIFTREQIDAADKKSAKGRP